MNALLGIGIPVIAVNESGKLDSFLKWEVLGVCLFG